MKKIAAISMVKNEADVIESFVRHTLDFVDKLYIVNHQSSDDTPAVLQKLQAEGLSLSVDDFTGTAQQQAEVMTQLLKKAVNDGAKIILPLDADEFLTADSGRAEDIRSLLATLDESKVYSLPWVRYVLQGKAAAGFLPAQAFWRERYPETLGKVVIGSQAAESTGLTIAQGNHFAEVSKDGRSYVVEALSLQGLHLAHIPWRSNEQAVCKAANGWLANVAKYSVNTNMANHWGRDFRLVSKGQELAPQPLKQPVAGKIAIKPHSLRYQTDLSKRVLQTVLATSEKMAMELRRETILRRQKNVLVVLPVQGKKKAFLASLEAALQSEYPYLQFAIWGETAEIQQNIEALLTRYDRTAFFVPPGMKLAAYLGTLPGDYVQWVMPGDEIRPYKIWDMLVTLEMQPEVDFVLSNAATCPAGGTWLRDLPVQDSYLNGDAKELRTYLLSTGKWFSGGISSALFRRRSMAACGWLEAAWAGKRFFVLLAWNMVLTAGVVGVFAEAQLARSRVEVTADDLCWRGIVWSWLLKEYKNVPEVLTETEYRSGCRALLAESKQVNLTAVEPQLAAQYQKVLQELR